VDVPNDDGREVVSYEVAFKMDLSSTKERGNDSSAPPKFQPHAQAREAERSALSATGRRPPPQRHTEPRIGEGVGGYVPTLLEYHFERKSVSGIISRHTCLTTHRRQPTGEFVSKQQSHEIGASERNPGIGEVSSADGTAQAGFTFRGESAPAGCRRRPDESS